MAQRLTEAGIKGLEVEPGQKDRLVFDTSCPGLGIRVTKAGAKVWLVQWTDPATRRKQRERLGVWPALTLDQARKAAQAKMGSVAIGVNPREERMRVKAEDDRRRAEEALTLEVLISDWAALHLEKHRRPGYAAEAPRTLRRVFADLLAKPAARIGRQDVLSRLDAMAKAGKTTAAGRALAYGRAAYAWAHKRGMVPDNPFADLPLAVPHRSRERVLTEGEVREVWEAAGGLAAPFCQFVRMLALTLGRVDEVAGVHWSELDLAGKVWTIPGARTKNSKAHATHLSPAALAVLETLPRVKGCDLVFSTTLKTPISGFSKLKKRLDGLIAAKRSEAAQKAGASAEDAEGAAPPPMPHWTFHDFRRSGASALAGVGFDTTVVDKLLNHQPAKLRGVAGVYQKYDFAAERARALDCWAALITELPVEPARDPLATFLAGVDDGVERLGLDSDAARAALAQLRRVLLAHGGESGIGYDPTKDFG